ncbi:MAG TPA: hypothetical protein VJ866_14295 [Pyrinomonadaceae bacterium]|nr:hypothetical protein [Pyrinomonadaceae bacterium]
MMNVDAGRTAAVIQAAFDKVARPHAKRRSNSRRWRRGRRKTLRDPEAAVLNYISSHSGATFDEIRKGCYLAADEEDLLCDIFAELILCRRLVTPERGSDEAFRYFPAEDKAIASAVARLVEKYMQGAH